MAYGHVIPGSPSVVRINRVRCYKKSSISLREVSGSKSVQVAAPGMTVLGVIMPLLPLAGQASLVTGMPPASSGWSLYGMRPIDIIGSMFMTWFFLVIILEVGRNRIIFSYDGIELKAPFKTVFMPWNEVVSAGFDDRSNSLELKTAEWSVAVWPIAISPLARFLKSDRVDVWALEIIGLRNRVLSETGRELVDSPGSKLVSSRKYGAQFNSLIFSTIGILAATAIFLPM